LQILPVVLCGGNGTRLWPLSRKSLPKQFAPIINGKSLLRETFERVKVIVGNSPIWAVANEEHRFLVRDAAEEAKVSCIGILEPVGRNTAAAMASAALNAKSEQLILFLPADHYVPDVAQFAQMIEQAVLSADQGAFVTFGVTPTHPHTGYGYIKVEGRAKTLFKVNSFVEKPNQEQALSYLEKGEYFWNSGIFLVRADVFLDALANFAPDILESTKKAVAKQRVDNCFIYLDKESFAECRSESIDYAVLEHHSNIVMMPFEGLWSDVGNWNSVANFADLDSNENSIAGKGELYDAKSTFIYAPYRPVVALGTQNLLIIDTPDALLVSSQSHAEQVKDVVTDLQEKNLQQATEHRNAKRPWGEYDTLDEGNRFKVKRIVVKPNASLSLQLHRHRAEHWIVVKGSARVTCDDKTFMLMENQSTYIPIGAKHRLENIEQIPLEMIEVQSGNYLGEDDIERFYDDYGRAPIIESNEKKRK
jgi:mannose-1-phosphate guanylyltransferase/mannose-6-phosphate isomerase